jgi:tRNA pseudouridine13 synthase
MSAPGLRLAWGAVPLSGRLRERPEDFVVEELLGFEPTGSGEHAFLVVEKRGANTEWVARQLARAAGVPPMAVGYAGLKDRHALTVQHYTVHLGNRPDPDWLAIEHPEYRVRSAIRHQRKLPCGAHAGNRFVIRLRGCVGDRDAAGARLARIAADGLPNWFGSQRFGIAGGNLELARALASGARLPRFEHGIALSTARAALFNAVLAARVADGSWNQARAGDVFQFDRGGSVFGPEGVGDDIAARVAAGGVHPTGPMWGQGGLRSAGAIAELEASVAAAESGYAEALVRTGLRQERRALRLMPQAVVHAWEDDVLTVGFELGRGAYATAVIGEIAETGQPSLADAAAAENGD